MCYFIADDSADMLEPAGRLLRVLWQLQPSLVSNFVSDKHLGPILKRLAASNTMKQRVALIRLVQDIWSFTAALQAEPLLVNAIPSLVKSLNTMQVAAGVDGQPSQQLPQQAFVDQQVRPAPLPLLEMPWQAYREAPVITQSVHCSPCVMQVAC